MRIKCTPLGAGQDIGKSCVLVSLGPNCNVLFDCGMHMGYTDERRYPDFAALPRLVASGASKKQQMMLGGMRLGRMLEELIDCVVVTHIHMDHCGALPHFTEVLGYRGPVYMTYPTKALAPLMIEDYRKVMVEKRGEKEAEHYTPEQIRACIERVTAVDIHQTIKVKDGLILRPYYAGHVLGAAMFYAEDTTTGVSALYTGDYSMTADRHLRPACVPEGLHPDLLITESTYATTIRDSRRAREMEFLHKVHACVRGGGRVLIPVFALGRAQELCILLDEYWEAHGITVPIYFSGVLTSMANVYYQMLLTWTNEKVQEAHGTRGTFEFKNVLPYDKSKLPIASLPPCVLFATPGMLTGGLSLEAFITWAPDPANLIVLPGICLAGTVGRKLQALAAGGGGGVSTGSALAASGGGRIQPGAAAAAHNKLTVDKQTEVKVSCQVHQLSFSPHTDSKGILELVRHVGARHVMLVHGEKAKMSKLRARIQDDLGLPCYDPPNLSTVTIPVTPSLPVLLSPSLAWKCREEALKRSLGAVPRVVDEEEGEQQGGPGSTPEGERGQQKRESAAGEAAPAPAASPLGSPSRVPTEGQQAVLVRGAAGPPCLVAPGELNTQALQGTASDAGLGPGAPASPLVSSVRFSSPVSAPPSAPSTAAPSPLTGGRGGRDRSPSVGLFELEPTQSSVAGQVQRAAPLPVQGGRGGDRPGEGTVEGESREGDRNWLSQGSELEVKKRRRADEESGFDSDGDR